MPWADETRTLELPADWTVQQIAAADVAPAGNDWAEHLAAAMARPEESLPLGKLLAARRSGRIVLIVEDMTRHSPLETILRTIFREVDHANIPRENVEIVFATGMHPPLSPEQAAKKIGPELASQVAWRCNPWRDRDAYVDLGLLRDGSAGLELRIDRGVAAADLRILVTSVSPHVQAGFGGGYKMLLPGCAQLDCIRQLHLTGLSRRPTQQVGQPFPANRMRRLIDAAGAAVDAAGGTSFGVQYVLDAADAPTAIAAGNVTACQRMLAKKCASAYGVLIDAPADVVIANAAPRDFDLWQSFKAIAHNCWAVRDNGVILCLTRCPGGVNMPTLSLPISPRWIRRGVKLLGAEALAALLVRLVPSLAGDAAFFARLALQILQRNTVLMVSPALAEADADMVGLPLFADPAEAIAAAEAQLGPGPKRVIFFPAGGATYPIMSRRPGTG
ncbi:MAG: hypothetical protein AMJ81_09005 [Phycisphaerae bacterium SM23_33]|nr:MAG: hypothetical protein AMJ81_09005 [Phycisphaerae bacterium SM23_33]